MSFTRLVRDYFWVLVVLAVMACAYAHASAITSLIGAALVPPAPSPSSGRHAASRPKPISTGPQRSAQPILDRNIFDSSLGALRPEADPPHVDRPSAPVDPLRALACEGYRVRSTVEESDPLASTAVIEAPGQQRGRVRRVGDPIGQMRVAYIGYNPRRRSPAVWLQEGQTLCQSVLFVDRPEPRRHNKSSKAKSSQAKSRARRRVKRRAPKLPRHIASKIERVGPTEYHVDRQVLDSIIKQQARLMRRVRVRPQQNRGKVTSLALTGIRPGTLLDELGFANGDRVQSVNGYALTSPEKALQAYARLRTSDQITVRLRRKGQPVELEYRVR